MNTAILFKELSQGHFPSLYKWLNTPHVIEFFQYEPISFDAVVEKYTPRLDKKCLTKMHIAYMDNKEFGYLQSYKVSDYPSFSKEIRENYGFSVDFYIGETSFLAQGLAHQMLSSYVSFIKKQLYPNEEYCYICHRKTNERAIRSSKRAGFIEKREVIEEGHLSLVLEKKV